MSIRNSLSNYFEAKEGKDTVLLSPRNSDNKIIFLGASVLSSVECGHKGLEPITFAATPKGETGLIAVAVWASDKSSHEWVSFLLRIGWKEDKPIIFVRSGDHQFVPGKDNIIQIKNNNYLEARIGEQWYTAKIRSSSHMSRKGAKFLPKSAGNLICKFGTGDKTVIPDIKKIAKEQEEEPGLKERIKGLEKELKEWEKEYKRVAFKSLEYQEKLKAVPQTDFVSLQFNLMDFLDQLEKVGLPLIKAKKEFLRKLLGFIIKYLRTVDDLNPGHGTTVIDVINEIIYLRTKLLPGKNAATEKISYKTIYSNLRGAIKNLAP